MGGLAIRKCTSRAPASRIMRTIFTEVVPRTRLSSMRTMRLPLTTDRLAECFRRTPSSRTDCLGRCLARQLRTHPLAHLVDVAAVHDRVGTGEVDVFEDARPHGLARRETD